MTDELSCEVCGAARLKSHYRCMKCQRWVCAKCYAPELRMCPPCAEANLNPCAEVLLQPRTWIEGLDELAVNLDVEKVVGVHEGILLTGKHGQYSLVDLLAAHVKLMQQVLDRDRSRGFDDKVH